MTPPSMKTFDGLQASGIHVTSAREMTIGYLIWFFTVKNPYSVNRRELMARLGTSQGMMERVIARRRLNPKWRKNPGGRKSSVLFDRPSFDEDIL